MDEVVGLVMGLLLLLGVEAFVWWLLASRPKRSDGRAAAALVGEDGRFRGR